MIPDDYVIMTIDIPDSVPVCNGSPMAAKTSAGVYPVWEAPSVIIPQENNVILGYRGCPKPALRPQVLTKPF